MNSQFVNYEVDNHTAYITLNRLSKKNALNLDMIQELRSSLNDSLANETVKTIIIQGKGNSFCSGMDISEISPKGPLDIYFNPNPLNEIYRIIKKANKPIIASVNGYALGGGLGIVALCHISVAAESAKFSLPEINLGLYPLGVVPAIWQVLGPKKTLQMGLTGEVWSAHEAKSCGLINYVVQDDLLTSKTKEIAANLNQKDSAALRAGIDCNKVLIDTSFWQQFEFLNIMLIPFYTSEGFAKKVNMFKKSRSGA